MLLFGKEIEVNKKKPIVVLPAKILRINRKQKFFFVDRSTLKLGAKIITPEIKTLRIAMFKIDYLCSQVQNKSIHFIES